MTEDWTSSDAIRVLGIALFRVAYKEASGALPSNGTMGEIAFEDAEAIMRRCPGLRYVLEAGVRSVENDELFGPWLISIYSGDRDSCVISERGIAATFPPDPEPDPNAMTADQVADAMIADLHERLARGEL